MFVECLPFAQNSRENFPYDNSCRRKLWKLFKWSEEITGHFFNGMLDMPLGMFLFD